MTQELDIDAHFHLIYRTIEMQHIERLMIDGITSYSITSDHHVITREFQIGPGGISLLSIDETKRLPLLQVP